MITALKKILGKRFVCAAVIAVSVGALAVFFVPVMAHADPAEGEDGTATVDVCGTGSESDKCDHFITTYINPAIMALTALVGIAAIISFIAAGIQYASSADDPGAVTKAKQRMFNTVLGLVAYIFLFAFLNYLIPGGLL